MPDHPPVFVKQGTRRHSRAPWVLLGFLLLLLAAGSGKVALALALLLFPLGLVVQALRSQPQPRSVPGPVGARAVSGPEVVSWPRACPHCGQAASGNFCAHCGTALTRTCAGCSKRGLESAFCPDCGSATYVPPTPD